MARIGGRNTFLAWVAGVFCAAAVIAMVVLAVPMIPVLGGWLSGVTQTEASAPGESAEDEPDGIRDCRELYADGLWSALRLEEDALLSQSQDPPVTTAGAVVEALRPQVIVTCDWRSAAGSISTTLATVPTDAGQVAAAALSTQGFDCDTAGGRTLCSRTDGDLVETIETGGGLWLSTSQTAWRPAGYVGTVSDRIFAD